MVFVTSWANDEAYGIFHREQSILSFENSPGHFSPLFLIMAFFGGQLHGRRFGALLNDCNHSTISFNRAERLSNLKRELYLTSHAHCRFCRMAPSAIVPISTPFSELSKLGETSPGLPWLSAFICSISLAPHAYPAYAWSSPNCFSSWLFHLFLQSLMSVR